MNNKTKTLITIGIVILLIGIVPIQAESFGYNYLKEKFDLSFSIKKLVELTIESLTGDGNAYACINENGTIYRSEVACV